jgi:hypothetical protein
MLVDPEFFDGRRSPAIGKDGESRMPVIVSQWGPHDTIAALPTGQPELFPKRWDRQALDCLVKRGIVHTRFKASLKVSPVCLARVPTLPRVPDRLERSA